MSRTSTVMSAITTSTAIVAAMLAVVAVAIVTSMLPPSTQRGLPGVRGPVITSPNGVYRVRTAMLRHVYA